MRDNGIVIVKKRVPPGTKLWDTGIASWCEPANNTGDAPRSAGDSRDAH